MNTRIEWLKQKRVWVGHDEWERKRRECVEKGELAGSKTVRRDWYGGLRYRVDRWWGDNFTALFVGEWREDHTEFTVYITHNSEERNTRKLSGKDAYRTVSKMFKERVGKGLKSAFGSVEKNSWHTMVPPPPKWQDPAETGEVVSHVYKADVSSCYPYELSKTLPSAKKKDTKTVQGRVSPTEEYPFAFYTKSGHMSIWQEFDTRDAQSWDVPTEVAFPRVMSKKGIPFYREVDDADEVTVLMKASPYSLADEMRTLYNGRNEHQEYKLVMNAFIGYLWSTRLWKTTNLSHIVAVVLNRARLRMMNVMREITERGGKPLLVAIDSVAWQYDRYQGWTDTKELGAFVREYVDVQLVMAKNGQYGLYDSKAQKFLSIKHQGVEAKDFEEKKQRIHTPADFYKEFTSVIRLYDRITGETKIIDTNGVNL